MLSFRYLPQGVALGWENGWAFGPNDWPRARKMRKLIPAEGQGER
jgi:hypothetical protein